MGGIRPCSDRKPWLVVATAQRTLVATWKAGRRAGRRRLPKCRTSRCRPSMAEHVVTKSGRGEWSQPGGGVWLGDFGWGG
jgi:hypothetical protein